MNIKWKYKEKVIGKSGDLLLARRSERRYAEQWTLRRAVENDVFLNIFKEFHFRILAEKIRASCFLIP